MSDCTDRCWAAYRAAKNNLENELRRARRRARAARDRADRWRRRCNDAKDDASDAYDAWQDAVSDLAAYPNSRRARAAVRDAKNAHRRLLRRSTRICERAARELQRSDDLQRAADALEDAYPDRLDQLVDELVECMLECT